MRIFVSIWLSREWDMIRWRVHIHWKVNVYICIPMKIIILQCWFDLIIFWVMGILIRLRWWHHWIIIRIVGPMVRIKHLGSHFFLWIRWTFRYVKSYIFRLFRRIVTMLVVNWVHLMSEWWLSKRNLIGFKAKLFMNIWIQVNYQTIHILFTLFLLKTMLLSFYLFFLLF